METSEAGYVITYEYNDLSENTVSHSQWQETSPIQDLNHLYTLDGVRLETDADLYNPWSSETTNYKVNVHEDLLGSGIYYTRQNTGYISNKHEYDAYGFNSKAPTYNYDPEYRATEPYFTGHPYDGALNLYYAHHRFYDAKTGQWLSEDPIQDGLNWYQYCEGNPVSKTDVLGLDVYYFYVSEWRGEAVEDRKILMEEYDLEIYQVHLIEIEALNAKYDVTGSEGFEIAWNTMGVDSNGKPVVIDAVTLNTHAEPERLLNNPETWNFTASDIETLGEKDVGALFLFGCNAGHQDYRYTNVAAAFAEKVNDAPVLASDGTVWHKIGGDYTSKNDRDFRKFRKKINLDSKRDNEGWLVYQQTESGLEISERKGKDLFLSDMIQISEYYNLLQCE